MPRSNKPTKPELTPEYLMTIKLVDEFRKTWASQFKISGMDPMLFSRLSLVALTQFSAITAVDIGMQTEQFLAVCKANFENAYANAPKFGP